MTVAMGRGLVPPDQPIVCADDLGVVRGDGVFETINVRHGVPFLLKEHLERIQNSAQAMEIDAPGSGELRGLVESAVEEWNTRSAEEAALRLVVTRGRPSGGGPTVFATVDRVDDLSKRPRTTGVALRSASLGVAAMARKDAPWLLGGVKAVSYATTMSVLRWAKGQGADDALWVSSDGYALEGPTSSLLWLRNGTLYTTSTETGVLPGTTSTFLLNQAARIGLDAKSDVIGLTDLFEVDAAWLSSSVRGVVFITEIDGRPMPQRPDIHSELQKLSGFTA